MAAKAPPPMNPDTTQVLRVFHYLDGSFLVPSGGGHDHGGQSGPKGTQMIIGSLLSLKTALVDIFPRIYIGLASSVAMMCPAGSIFRKVFGGLFLPFLVFLLLFHYHIYYGVIPHIGSGRDACFLMYSCFLAITVISYLVVQCSEVTDLSIKEEKEVLDVEIMKDPILSKSPVRCPRCQIPNVLRAHHCMLCNTHTAKFHEHNAIFNKCIGAGNMIPYTLFYLFLSLLMLMGLVSIQMPKEEGYTLSKPKQMWYNFTFICYLGFFFGRLQTFFVNVAHIYFNITCYEFGHWPQLSYFWKNPRKEFFNPFDKGPSKNFKEEAYSLLNYNEKPKELNKSGDSLEETQLRDMNEDPEDSETKKLMDERNRIVNWRAERFLSITSLYSSPMRAIFMEFIRKQNQRQNQNQNQGGANA